MVEYLPERLAIEVVGWKRFLERWNEQVLTLVKTIWVWERRRTSGEPEKIEEYSKRLGYPVPREIFDGGLRYPGQSEEETNLTNQRLKQIRQYMQKQADWYSKTARENGKTPIMLEGDEEVLRRDSLFSPPVSSKEITKAEEHLQSELPPSYKGFLSVSNGWVINNEILLPVHNIGRFSEKEFEEYDNVRAGAEDCWYQKGSLPPGREVLIECASLETLPHLVVINQELSGSIGHILLNPQEKSEQGEWEVWLTLGYGGISRFQSFGELMELLYMYDIGWYRRYADDIDAEWKIDGK